LPKLTKTDVQDASMFWTQEALSMFIGTVSLSSDLSAFFIFCSAFSFLYFPWVLRALCHPSVLRMAVPVTLHPMTVFSTYLGLDGGTTALALFSWMGSLNSTPG